MITDVALFFSQGCGRCARFATPDCSTRQWDAGLRALREICREVGLTETAKWGHPCYMHADRNVAVIGALRGDFRLSFFDAALLEDPQGVLEKQGPNTQHPDMIRFTANDQVPLMAPIIRAYLQELMGHVERGVRPAKSAAAFELPDELVDALHADPELSDAFHALTPGRQRSYVINLRGARQAATRVARIAKFRSKILDGKGALER